jgi:SAM-dependent methyltransferase
VKDYLEDLWARLPTGTVPSDLTRRSEFLLSELAGGERLLDVGCGAGEFSAIAAGAGAAVIGVEVAEAALARARRAHPDLDFRLAQIDAALPFDDTSFDIVWAGEVIEHVADTARWLSEVRRVLVPGGRLLLSTPSHGRVRLLVGGIERYSEPLGDHLHLYSVASLHRLLDEFGFGEIEIEAVGGPPLMRRTLLARAVR